MCLMCLKNDVFGGRNPTSRELVRERAMKVKRLLKEADDNKLQLCYVGDAAVELLKKEQYDLAKEL
jgi:energy-converting hydrogenase A subunit M